jgi:hypothetical protein
MIAAGVVLIQLVLMIQLQMQIEKLCGIYHQEG